MAQINLPSGVNILSDNLNPRDIAPDQSGENLSNQPLPKLPPVDELLGNPNGSNNPDGITSGSDETFVITGIELVGSSIFTTEDFADQLKS